MTTAGGSLCIGEVVHKRLTPAEHKLRYRVFSLLLDVDRLNDVQSKLRWFSVDRFNLFSLNRKQHGYRDERSLSQFGWDQVERLGLTDEVDRIEMLFYPRIFGFAFNPLTVYFCRETGGSLAAVIYEVRNTFGEHLTYVMRAGDPESEAHTHRCAKRFYVSPFNPVAGDYLFHVRAQDDDLTVGVALKENDEPTLRTHFRARNEPLSDRSLLSAWVRHPLMTLKVVAAIHWEAAKLWRKGLTMKERPSAPSEPIVYG
ncbi:MAG: DUF1365 domain-containing protein [Ahrensia sp.]|nr:DUF1365 domain-containing protein [Ahrensia sp.]